MELINTTPLVADLRVGRRAASGRRMGIVVAKATYRYDARGQTWLDSDSPLPLFCPDELTPLGLLPRDDLPRNDDAFEVSLLGCAHAPGGRPVSRMTVSLTVADRTHEIVVFGDREWSVAGPGVRITEPEPFTKMPLTWSRAFGGSCDVEVDVDSPVLVSHDENPEGLGFDPAPKAKELDAFLSCPAGYPRFPKRRRLPNLERPEALIREWVDSPAPAGWSPLLPSSGMQARRSHVVREDGERKVVVPTAGRLHRAHPDWVFDRAPPALSPIVMEGLSPEGRVSLRLPELTVHLDYVLGARTGSRSLSLHALVLLPEEQRFCLVYRHAFEVDAPEGEERGARLRIERGRRA
jgi:hypothetical protein